MNNNVIVLLTILLTALTWAITIYLILVRRFQNQAAILKYNFWTAFLMWANLLVCLPALFYLGREPVNWLIRQGWLLATVTDILATVGLLAFIVLIWGLRYRKITGGYDYLIVLGAGLNNGQVPPVLAARLDYARQLWQTDHRARIIVTGGFVHHDTISEAQTMGKYLIAHGVTSSQIIYEDRALNTWQNLQNCMELINGDWDGLAAPRIVVINSSFHVLRAQGYARRLGLTLQFSAAPTPWQYQPLTVVRDYLGNIRDHRYLAVVLLICQFLVAEILVL